MFDCITRGGSARDVETAGAIIRCTVVVALYSVGIFSKSWVISGVV